MDPIIGNRWFAVTPERIAWHAFTLGILALLLLVLLVSVQSLGEPRPGVDAPPPERATRPEPERSGASDAPRRVQRAEGAWPVPSMGAAIDPAWCRPGPCASV